MIEERVAKGDGETWEAYAHRLEHRIKEQREHINSLEELREAGNRITRTKNTHLRMALGKMTERWERERTQKFELVQRLREQDERLG